MEVLTKLTFKMPTDNDYKFIKAIVGAVDQWPIEEYDDINRIIEIAEIYATEDDAVELAQIIHTQLSEHAMKSEDRIKDILQSIEFQIEGHTNFASAGEELDFIIERKDGDLMIQETANYTFFGFDYFENYEEFCEYLETNCAEDVTLAEDEFDPENEYAITFNKVYVDETPEYGAKYSINAYQKMGLVSNESDDDVLSGDLSLEEAYAVLAGTRKKDTLANSLGKSETISFKDKLFVLTGFDTRTENFIIDAITSRGGIIKSSTVLKTDYLIYDEIGGRGTTKYNRAQELNKQGKNIQIISGARFVKMIK